MKRFRFTKTLILILLTAVLVAALPVSAGTEVRTASPVSVNNSRTLNVLFIGNSFSLDTTGYLYDIVKQTGCRICLGVGWISGAKLPAHVSNALSDAQKYTYDENTSGSWGTKKYKKKSEVETFLDHEAEEMGRDRSPGLQHRCWIYARLLSGGGSDKALPSGGYGPLLQEEVPQGPYRLQHELGPSRGLQWERL